MRITICATLTFALCVMGGLRLSAQSTYGTILGTVKDNSGALIPNAIVRIINTDENTTRVEKTNQSGDYNAQNLLPARYSIEVTSEGFQTFSATELLLVARQTLRVDATLQVGQMAQTVTVESSEAGVIATDTQQSRRPSIRSNS